jgi:hypothetical protein
MTEKPNPFDRPPKEAPIEQVPEETPDALENAEREAARRWLMQMSRRNRNDRLANGRAGRRRETSCQ